MSASWQTNGKKRGTSCRDVFEHSHILPELDLKNAIKYLSTLRLLYLGGGGRTQDLPDMRQYTTTLRACIDSYCLLSSTISLAAQQFGSAGGRSTLRCSQWGK